MLIFLKKVLILIFLTIGVPLGLWLSGFIVFTASIYFMSEPKMSDSIDGAIVLTGGSNRVGKGLDLLAEKKISNLLVSGVHKDVDIRDIMKLWGKKDGIPPCCITLGREAGNTIGNAREARKWIEFNEIKAVYLITANYHIPRAMLEFNHKIPNIKIVPFPVKPENFDIRKPVFWRTDFIEYHKLLMTLFRIVVFPSETQPFPEALKI
jgi:uncharacterized SAM-binding protein YcdF (DUF218 family)